MNQPRLADTGVGDKRNRLAARLGIGPGRVEFLELAASPDKLRQPLVQRAVEAGDCVCGALDTKGWHRAADTL